MKKQLGEKISQHKEKLPQISFARLLPNIITLLALCTGLSALRFALMHQWQMAVMAIILAAVLDGMDGRIARMLGSSSRFGAELDSLSDFISFGIAPSFVIYVYTLHTLGGLGWGFCLFFSVCQALRLARFNTQSIQAGMAPQASTKPSPYSVGVPAPAGAYLALMPMMAVFAFGKNFALPANFYAGLVLCIALLMVSKIPTFVFKSVRIAQGLVLPLFALITIAAAALASEPWPTLLSLGMIYVFSIPVSALASKRNKDL